MQEKNDLFESFLSHPLDKLELARKVELSKILIQIFNGCVMFAFHYDILVDDLTALAVNYIDLGDKTVNSFILNHTYKVTYKTQKSEQKNAIICVCSVAYKLISRTEDVLSYCIIAQSAGGAPS